MVEHLRRMVPADWPWSVCAIGRAQLPLNAYCILAGGHVRTGLEDNPTMDAERRVPARNPALVARVAELAGIAGRPLATPAQVRERLGIAPAAAGTAAAATPRRGPVATSAPGAPAPSRPA
jgi:3-keto-5-aminohexanoate cleavage enzyme